MSIISSFNDDHDSLLPLPFLSQAVSDRWYISDDLDEVSRIIHHHDHRHHIYHRHLHHIHLTLSTSVASIIITVRCITVTITYMLFLLLYCKVRYLLEEIVTLYKSYDPSKRYQFNESSLRLLIDRVMKIFDWDDRNIQLNCFRLLTYMVEDNYHNVLIDSHHRIYRTTLYDKIKVRR